MNDTITGKALGIFWSGSQPSEIPQNRLELGIEHLLRLGQGKIVSSMRDRDDCDDWILFQNASLNLQSFYQYFKLQMIPVSKLYDWSIANAAE